MKKSFLPAILLLIFMLGGVSRGQTVPEPYQEKLLNGLKVLVWNDPKADKVTLKLRIQAGSMFDPKDKMGVMALLSDILFPDPQTFNYFTEDLQGKLEVTDNYDYIQITATGKADEFIDILDTIRVAVVNTPITQENFVKVRDARLEKAKEEAANIAMIADQTAARRLLGDFPYGRPEKGTPESIARIDRFDLVTAKEKFLDADNATLAITGKVDPRFAVRAVKQMFGNWVKSDGIVPATFTQPGEPDTRVLVVDQPGAANAEIRFAVRGLAANDDDGAAFILWMGEFREKLASTLPSECAANLKVNHRSHLLPGILTISDSVSADNAAKCYNAIKGAMAKIEAEKVNPQDFNETKNSVIGVMTSRLSDPDHVSDLWLAAETFKWGRAADHLKKLNAALPEGADKAAARIFWKAPVVSVIAGDAARIKPQFAAGMVFGLTPEQELAVKKEIIGVLTAWKDSQEKRDIEAHLKFYGEKLETFNKENNKTREDVRADRQKIFEQYDVVGFRLDKIGMFIESENLVRLLFDRSWTFRGKAGSSKGSAQQEMKMVKTDGVWQIVSEKDLQTYFVENQAKDTPPAAPAKPR